VSDHSGASVELGNCAEIDGEGQLNLLSLPQSEVGRFDEHAGSAEIHGAT